jgi:ABC-type branched-subunit amino acid transport system substrate-binding protein
MLGKFTVCLLSALLASTAVQAADIVVGQVASLSGQGSAELGQGMRQGVEACFAQVNAAGGIKGQKLKLVSEDDHYVPAETVKLTAKLLQTPNLVALTSFRGTETTLALAKSGLLAKSGVSLVGTLSGAEEIQGVPNIYHTRISFQKEIEKLILQINTMGMKRIGVFHPTDTFGRSGMAAATKALASLGSKPAAEEAYGASPTPQNIDKSVQALMRAKLNAVVVIASNAPAYQFIKRLRELSPATPIYAISVVDYEQVVKVLGPKAARGIGFSQVSPFPFSDAKPVVREYRKALSKYVPGAKPSYFSMQGFINAKILVLAMQKADKPLTSKSVSAALAKLGPVDLGGFVINFDKRTHNGSDYAGLSVVGANGQLIH